MFDQDLAVLYDTVYRGRGKDYDAEARDIARLVRDRKPTAATLLDVACGTGAHLVPFQHLFDHVEGIERGPDMRAVAHAKLPGVPLHSGDMCEFALGRSFDAAVCLFASVNYLHTLDQLHAAAARIVDHVVPGGVVVIEPWWFPEQFIDGYISHSVVRADGRTVSRMSRTTRDGDARHTRMEIHFTVADTTGIRHFTETHVMSLFSRDECLDALHRAGCTATYVAVPGFACGLFVGVRS